MYLGRNKWFNKGSAHDWKDFAIFTIYIFSNKKLLIYKILKVKKLILFFVQKNVKDSAVESRPLDSNISPHASNHR